MPSFLLALEAAGVAAGLGWQGAGNSISAQDWLAEFASNCAGRPVLIIDDAQILPQDVMDFLCQLIASARCTHDDDGCAGYIADSYRAYESPRLPGGDRLSGAMLVGAGGGGTCHAHGRCPGRCRGPATYRVRYAGVRSEEHTSELQSLMRISYAVFCLKKKQ